jgi:glycosyltransferase involved in cell wall biosynthesis
MRILIVSQYFWPENFRVNDLVYELTRRGHSVVVLTGLPNYPSGKVFPAYRANPSKFALYEGANIVRVPVLSRGKGGFRLLLNYLSFVILAATWGSWRLRRVNVDAIFVFEPSPVTVGLPAIVLGKLKCAPVIFWVLDLWPETLSALGVVRSPRLLNLIGKMVGFIYDRCALVLGQSHSFLDSIALYCNDKNKIRYFPSWAEDLFKVGAVAPAIEIPMKPDGFNVVFSGNIGEAQDMPAVLDAAELLKENSTIRWIIIGGGRKLEWLADQLVVRGLKENVLVLGQFPVDRMPSFYAHADALLVSMKRDPVFSKTIPGKVQSYLMAGIPLLGMLDGEGAELIRYANAGLVCEAGDSVGLAKAVIALASMTLDERNQLGKNGQKYAMQEFDRSRLMDRLENLLNEALNFAKSKL